MFNDTIYMTKEQFGFKDTVPMSEGNKVEPALSEPKADESYKKIIEESNNMQSFTRNDEYTMPGVGEYDYKEPVKTDAANTADFDPDPAVDVDFNSHVDNTYSTDAISQSKEDTTSDGDLLAQIDAFREKAKELSELIAAKEHRISDLENSIEENEGKVANLGGVTCDFDREFALLNHKLDTITDTVKNSIAASSDSVSAQIRSIRDDIANSTPAESETQATPAVAEVNFDGLKEEVAEKIHSENVKLYRNVSDLFKEANEAKPQMDDVSSTILKKVKSAKRSAGWAVLFALIDLIGILGLLAMKLMELGLLHF